MGLRKYARIALLSRTTSAYAAGHAQTGAQSSPDSALEWVISDQQDQIEFLRRELERKDTILMSLVQRVPELEAPREPREESVSASEEQGDGE